MEINSDQEFVAWLDDELKARRLSPGMLSIKSGVHKDTIVNYIGRRNSPQLSKMLAVCKGLGYKVVLVKR